MASTDAEREKPRVTETSTGSSISYKGWTLASASLPISNAVEISTIQDELKGLPLPEMPFGNNSLLVRHEESQWTYVFDTTEALRGVRLGEMMDGDGGVQVGYAKEWLKSRSDPSGAAPAVVLAKPFDWTYTTTYNGHALGSHNFSFKSSDPSNPHHSIPIAELSRPDPILFYAEIPLFEDELHDNGEASFMIRARVMPTSFFILARFSLRVDNVLFRLHDTRIYHSFASSPPLVVRETSGWEAPYEAIKAFLPTPDLSPLTDANFVSRAISSLPQSITQHPTEDGPGTRTGWRALGTRVEVLELV